MISPVAIWRNQKTVRALLGKKGVIISWTVITTPPPAYKSFAPYVSALIELETGERVFGIIVDCHPADIVSGIRVEAVLRKVREVHHEDIIPYGVKFRLLPTT